MPGRAAARILRTNFGPQRLGDRLALASHGSEATAPPPPAGAARCCALAVVPPLMACAIACEGSRYCPCNPASSTTGSSTICSSSSVRLRVGMAILVLVLYRRSALDSGHFESGPRRLDADRRTRVRRCGRRVDGRNTHHRQCQRKCPQKRLIFIEPGACVRAALARIA